MGERMQFTFGTPALWLSQARDARELADTIDDALTRKATLRIAEDFEQRAEEGRTRIMGLALTAEKNVG